MASIYNNSGETITLGLNGCNVSDETLQIARRQAAEREEAVILNDDDGEWVVNPDGSTQEFTAAMKREWGFEA